MARSYMPVRQAERVAWAINFRNHIAQTPGAWGLTQALVGEFEDVVTTLQEKWALVLNPATKTKQTVADKDDAMKAMMVMARNLVSIIQGTPAVTDGMKLNAGLTVRDVEPTPIPRPTIAPLIKVVSVVGRIVTVQLLGDGTGRGRPPQVAGATVFTHFGDQPPQAGGKWDYATLTTRTRVELTFPASETGQSAWIIAQWRNGKDQTGPASAAVNVLLPAAGVQPPVVGAQAPMKLVA